MRVRLFAYMLCIHEQNYMLCIHEQNLTHHSQTKHNDKDCCKQALIASYDTSARCVSGKRDQNN
jgi:hypothetical protein